MAGSPGFIVTLCYVTATGTGRTEPLEPLGVVLPPLGRRVRGGLAGAGGGEGVGAFAGKSGSFTGWNSDYIDLFI